MLDGGSVCRCMQRVCRCSLADEAKLILWWARGSPVEKKKPAKSAFVPTGPLSDRLSHTHTHIQRCVAECLAVFILCG